ncbi:MAG: hypothetical protein H6810_02205 [Phycisphaeraceae bacterium]|nr:MAG: hypothetical protein H6810_02205 [Phycisphaeraceae bacterium]
MQFRVVTVVATALFVVAVPFTWAGDDVSGKLVVFGDEWAVSDTAFDEDLATTTQFALNLADYFATGDSGVFLIYSQNPFAYGQEFIDALTAAGHTVADNPPDLDFTPEGLASYDGVFLAGPLGSGPGNASVLADYIRAGGSVMVSAGTGSPFSGAPGEAAAWNPLLNAFGLAFGAVYYGLPTTTPLLDVPLLPTVSLLGRNLDSVLWGYGQEVIVIDPSDPGVSIELTGDFTGMTQPPPGGIMPIAGAYNIPACALADIAEPFGLLDLADVTTFITEFVGMGSIADFNGDGLFDLSDIGLFVNSFVAGCP